MTISYTRALDSMGHRTRRYFQRKYKDGDDGGSKKRGSRGERATQSRKTSTTVESIRFQLHKVKRRLRRRGSHSDSDSDGVQSFGCPRGMKKTGSRSSEVSLSQGSLRTPALDDNELQH